MISNQHDKCRWEFVFLGANINAAKEVENLGEDLSKDINNKTNKKKKK